MNLYKQITTDQKYYARPDFHIEMDHKLHALFQFLFHTELKPLQLFSDPFSTLLYNPIDNNIYFEFIYNSSSMYRLVYHFMYDGHQCMAVIEVDKFLSFYVTFNFNIASVPASMLMKVNTIKILVTEDLNFISASLQKRFNFGWNSEIVSKETSGTKRTSIFINKSINTDFSIQTSIQLFISGAYQNVHFVSENSLYFKDHAKFEHTYLRLLNYCENQPEAFSSVFTEYPTHLEMMTGTSILNDFLIKFEDDYCNNLPVLNDKLLLLDMQEI